MVDNIIDNSTPATTGSNAAPVTTPNGSSKDNLSINTRRRICERWLAFVRSNSLTHPVYMADGDSGILINCTQGDPEVIAIKFISMRFYHLGKREDGELLVGKPESEPFIVITASHTNYSRQRPEFLAAVGGVISKHIKKYVSVSWLQGGAATSYLICADPKSAWRIADFMLAQKSY